MGNLFSARRHAPPSTVTTQGFSANKQELEINTTNIPSRARSGENRKRTLQTEEQVKRRVRSRGSEAALQTLAGLIVENKNVVFITGAGLSVASGIRPFRSNPLQADGEPSSPAQYDSHKRPKHVLQAGLWNDVIWSTATRESFRKDPAKWYTEFWIPHFCGQGKAGLLYRPNRGHHALQSLLKGYSNVKQITQNIDGLQNDETTRQQLVEVHGRANLFKCCPDSDSENDDDSEDGDSDSDDDGERTVHLGHRRKSRWMRQRYSNEYDDGRYYCPYQYLESLTADQLKPFGGFGDTPSSAPAAATASDCSSSGSATSMPRSGLALCNGQRSNMQEPVSSFKDTVPSCPACGNNVMPQALLFDEGYHSHSFYQFETVEDWLHAADVIVFVGTSFAVRLTQVALQQARDNELPVYNFNLQHDRLKSTARLNVSNIVGPATETLPKLVDACCQLQQEKRQELQQCDLN